MRPIDDPSSLTPEERFSEIATILAGGVLRHSMPGQHFPAIILPRKNLRIVA